MTTIKREKGKRKIVESLGGVGGDRGFDDPQHLTKEKEIPRVE